MTRDGVEHLIPNETLISEPVENWTHTQRRTRLKLDVGVHHESDLRAVIALCEEAARSTERVLPDPAPKCLFIEFGESSLKLQLRFWIGDAQNGVQNVKSDVLHRDLGAVQAARRARAVSAARPAHPLERGARAVAGAGLAERRGGAAALRNGRAGRPRAARAARGPTSRRRRRRRRSAAARSSLSLIVTVNVLEPSSVAPPVRADSVSVNVSAPSTLVSSATGIAMTLSARSPAAQLSVPRRGRVVDAFGRRAAARRVLHADRARAPDAFAARGR